MICSDIWHKYHAWYFKIVSNFTRLTAREITYNNFETSLVVFMPNITTNPAITYTYSDLTCARLLAVFKSLEVICIALTSAISETFTFVSVRIEEIPRNRSLARSCFRREIAGFQFTVSWKKKWNRLQVYIEWAGQTKFNELKFSKIQM